MTVEKNVITIVWKNEMSEKVGVKGIPIEGIFVLFILTLFSHKIS